MGGSEGIKAERNGRTAVGKRFNLKKRDFNVAERKEGKGNGMI
jgi:hypothetical protein